jgi:hypothetical protein
MFHKNIFCGNPKLVAKNKDIQIYSVNYTEANVDVFTDYYLVDDKKLIIYKRTHKLAGPNIRFSKCGKFFLSVSSDYTIKLWEIPDQSQIVYKPLAKTKLKYRLWNYTIDSNFETIIGINSDEYNPYERDNTISEYKIIYNNNTQKYSFKRMGIFDDCIS